MSVYKYGVGHIIVSAFRACNMCGGPVFELVVGAAALL